MGFGSAGQFHAVLSVFIFEAKQVSEDPKTTDTAGSMLVLAKVPLIVANVAPTTALGIISFVNISMPPRDASFEL